MNAIGKSVIFALEFPEKIGEYMERGFERTLGPAFDFMTGEHLAPSERRRRYGGNVNTRYEPPATLAPGSQESGRERRNTADLEVLVAK